MGSSLLLSWQCPMGGISVDGGRGASVLMGGRGGASVLMVDGGGRGDQKNVRWGGHPSMPPSFPSIWETLINLFTFLYKGGS